MSNAKRKHENVVHHDTVADKHQVTDETIHIFRKAEIGIHEDSEAAANLDKEYEAFQKLMQLETENAEKLAEASEMQALLDMSKEEEKVTLEWQKRVQDLKSLVSETIHAPRGAEQDNNDSSNEEEDDEEEAEELPSVTVDNDIEDMEAIESFFRAPSSHAKK